MCGIVDERQEREEVPHVEAEEEVSQAEPVEGGQGKN